MSAASEGLLSLVSVRLQSSVLLRNEQTADMTAYALPRKQQ